MKRPFATCLFLLLTTTMVFAQTPVQTTTLSDQFNQIIEKAETYEKYKVISTNKLLTFKSAMLDSLMAYQSNINRLETDLVTLQAEFKSLKDQFEQTQSTLATTEAEKASISFLGLSVNKLTYNLAVWAFILLLVMAIGILYFRIKHVCAVAKRVKTAYSKIMDEYRAQRFQSVEKQMKLKRELQTVQNRLDSLQAEGLD
jgi:DNA repair exonuclease SbcCD ATPase subunit